MAETHKNNEPKKSPKKLIILIVLALLLIGGGAGGYYYFFMKKAPDAAHAKGAEKDKHATEEHQEADAHEAPADPEVFYDLPSPLIVDFPAGSSAKVIKVSITILVKGETSSAALKKNDPMLRNNLLMIISALGADKAKTIEGKLELRALMLAEIGKVLEKMAGKNTVKDVYFTDFVMQ
jgi:flagellar FliL protein